MVARVDLSDDLCENWYPRAESNRNRKNRNLEFYPLNYGGKRISFWPVTKNATLPDDRIVIQSHRKYNQILP